MPSADTFSIPPINRFVRRYLQGVSVDPFSRSCDLATHTNDINPATTALRGELTSTKPIQKGKRRRGEITLKGSASNECE